MKAKTMILMILAVIFIGTSASAQGKRSHKAKSKIALNQIRQDSINARQDSLKLRQDSILIMQYNAITAHQDSIITKENAMTIHQDSINMFKQEAGIKISANETNISALKVGITTEKKKLRAKRGLDLAKIEQKNIDLKNKLNNYIDDGQYKWASFQIEINQGLDEVSKAITDFSVVKPK